MKSAIFLDRDDTIIRNVPYLGDPTLVELMPGALEGLRKFQEKGWPLFVVSNQSGVGRGLITREQVALVNQAMESLLVGIKIAGYYLCYEEPGNESGLTERKPSPALLLRAAREHGLDLASSYMIGDRLSDVQCGKNAGCQSILTLGHSGEDDLDAARSRADFVAENLLVAARWVLGQSQGVEGKKS
jgi:D-glycero-D-manno-heptose 1,7-bisphosphate phosphatase